MVSACPAHARSLPRTPWPVSPPTTVPITPNVVSFTSGTNDAVTVTMERVPVTNPRFYAQHEYTALPNLATASPSGFTFLPLSRGAPGEWSVVLGNKQSLAGGGPLLALNDGYPSFASSPESGSVFSTTGDYGLLYDLGTIKPVSSITTYSAGPAGNGAGQNYQVWGSDTLLPIVAGQDPYATGWRRIAIGAAHAVWGDTVLKGGAVGIHLTSRTGDYIGNFRYILFGMQDTGRPGAQGAQAMMAEITIRTSLSDQGYDFKVNDDGTATITRYTGPGGAVGIPATLRGYPVVAIGDSAFFADTSLTSVGIPESVISVGHYAFAQCTELTTAIVAASVRFLGDQAFATGWVESRSSGEELPGVQFIFHPGRLSSVYFCGDAPQSLSPETYVGQSFTNPFEDASPPLIFYHRRGASGFTSPTWAWYPTAEFPTLSITATEGGLLLSWPLSATGWTLESTSALSDPDSWKPVPTTPVETDGTYRVRETLTGPAKFYRLNKRPAD